MKRMLLSMFLAFVASVPFVHAQGSPGVVRLPPAAGTYFPCSLMTNVVPYSATPTFNGNVCTNVINLTGPITSFTLPAPAKGYGRTCITFVQPTASFNLVAGVPANVIGFKGVTIRPTSGQSTTCLGWTGTAWSPMH